MLMMVRNNLDIHTSRRSIFFYFLNEALFEMTVDGKQILNVWGTTFQEIWSILSSSSSCIPHLEASFVSHIYGIDIFFIPAPWWRQQRLDTMCLFRPRWGMQKRGAGVCTFSIKSADLELALIDHIPFPFSVTRHSPFPHLTRSLADPGPSPHYSHYHHHHHVSVIYLIALLLSSVYQLPVRAAEAQTELHSDGHSLDVALPVLLINARARKTLPR